MSRGASAGPAQDGRDGPLSVRSGERVIPGLCALERAVGEREGERVVVELDHEVRGDDVSVGEQ